MQLSVRLPVTILFQRYHQYGLNSLPDTSKHLKSIFVQLTSLPSISLLRWDFIRPLCFELNQLIFNHYWINLHQLKLNSSNYSIYLFPFPTMFRAWHLWLLHCYTFKVTCYHTQCPPAFGPIAWPPKLRHTPQILFLDSLFLLSTFSEYPSRCEANGWILLVPHWPQLIVGLLHFGHSTICHSCTHAFPDIALH